MPEETKELVADFLADQAEVMVLLHDAARIAECRYPSPYVGGKYVGSQHLGQARECARRLELLALLAAEEGQTGKAADALDASFALADSLPDKPFLIAQLVRFACLSLSVDGMERTMNRTQFAPAQRKVLAARLVAAERPDAIWRCVVSERCARDVSMMSEDKGWEEVMSLMPNGGVLLRAPVVRANARLMNLSALGRLIGPTRVPVEQRTESMSRLVQEFEVECEEAAGGDPDLVETYKLFAGLEFQRVVLEELKIIARLRAARTALAIEGFREAQKRLPESLAELVPKCIEAVPLDPFDGKPLRFKKLEKGYVVYSIGQDGADQGGADRGDEGTDDENFDVPFRVVGRKGSGD